MLSRPIQTANYTARLDQSWDKTKKDYRTLVAAAKRLKLPDDTSNAFSNPIPDAETNNTDVTPYARGSLKSQGLNQTAPEGGFFDSKQFDLPSKTASGTRNRGKELNSDLKNAPKTELDNTMRTLSLTDNKKMLVPGENSQTVQKHIPRVRSTTPESIQEEPEVPLSEILKYSNQVISLKFDHLYPHKAMENARKLGLLSGSKAATA
jgi:hypothetical protein